MDEITSHPDIECFFSGKSNVNKVLAAKILAANSSLFLAMFTLTDRSLIDALMAAKNNGIDVLAIFDETQLKEQPQILLELTNSDIIFRTMGSAVARMHHKFLVIDIIETITGSFNWTNQAGKSNCENIVVIKNSSIANEYIGEFKRLWEFVSPKGFEHYLKKKEPKDEIDLWLEPLKGKVLTLANRDKITSMVYQLKNSNDFNKALRLIEFLLSVDSSMIWAVEQRKEVLRKLRLKSD